MNMAIFTIPEILDAVMMSALLGYLFSSYFSRYNNFRKPRDYSNLYNFGRRFSWSDFWFSVSLFAPAIILHELGHKFVAMAFGYDATFFSAISINKIIHGMPFLDFPAILMIIALIATYFVSTFLFFVPAYVSFSSMATPVQQMFIAFAGPGVNLILWLASKYLIKYEKIPKKYIPLAVLTSRINMILFFFNMIPLPGLDGFTVFRGLFSILF